MAVQNLHVSSDIFVKEAFTEICMILFLFFN